MISSLLIESGIDNSEMTFLVRTKRLSWTLMNITMDLSFVLINVNVSVERIE